MEQELQTESVKVESDAPESVKRARGEWSRFGTLLASITPRMVARFLVFSAFVFGIAWLLSVAWVALLPFFIGGTIAYALLPLVNRLDRFMPRFLAAILALIPVVALVVLFVWLLIPIAIRQFTLLAANLPADTDIQSYLEQARAYINSLPPSTQTMIYNLLAQTRAALESRGAEISTQLVGVLLSGTQSVFSTLGFLLGFVVVPAWVLTLLNEQPNAARAVRNLLPAWAQADAWAVLRILDRSLGWFLRGQVMLGIVAGFLVFVGLEVLVRVVGREGNLNYQLLLALWAGLMYLIPFIGPILGAVPGILLGFSLSPQLGIGAIVVYLAVQFIMDNIFGVQIQRRIAGLNLNLLILAIIAMSQISFWLLLIAAPITGIVFDLFRYVYGRFSDPPRPAGIIPSDAAWKLGSAPRAAAPPRRSLIPTRRAGPIRSGKS